ncbi:BlaR1 peptidase M56 [Novipirellula aureliae]|uniref:BlaR1 peptidase M56 n=1 Tax=Novipirellula aureliae TaxID=2527966 RepID=A0A5C6EAY3_9BACT|nr:M56 family metallopeptidase [Novipirellula aureliae]TWU45654.1 BlaR1 peptidase M56 [Novipirellula aureliae]
MISSQPLVIGWIECATAGTILLIATKTILGRLGQPVDRVNFIVMSLVVSTFVPLLVCFASLPGWHLGLFSTDQELLAATKVASTTDVAIPPQVSVPRTTARRPTEQLEETISPQPLSEVNEIARIAAPPDSLTSNRLDVWLITATILLMSHGLAISYFIFEWIVGAIRLRKLCRNAPSPGSSVLDIWTQISGDLGDSVRLHVTPQITAPMVFGWRQYLLWYQPLFWILRRELRICQDLVADDRAAGVTGDPLDRIEYSELLLSIAKNTSSPNIAGAIGFYDRPSQLSRRIKMLLNSEQSLRERSPRVFLLLSGLFMLIASLLVGTVRLSTARADEGVFNKPAAIQNDDATRSAALTSKPLMKGK